MKIFHMKARTLKLSHRVRSFPGSNAPPNGSMMIFGQKKSHNGQRNCKNSVAEQKKSSKKRSVMVPTDHLRIRVKAFGKQRLIYTMDMI